MDNILFIKKNTEIEQLCKELGFAKTIFLEDVLVIKETNHKDLQKQLKQSRGRYIIFIPKTEEMLRFVLERTSVNMVLNIEEVHIKDSVHFLRGGLDQVLCKIAADKGKVIGFSFTEILNSNNKGKLLARIRFNLQLCKKYQVKILFSNFSVVKEELRSKKDLDTFLRIIQKPF